MEGQPNSDRPFHRDRSSQVSTPYSPISPPDDSEDWRDSAATIGGGYFGNFQGATWDPNSPSENKDNSGQYIKRSDSYSSISPPPVSHTSREIPITLQVRPALAGEFQNVGLNSPVRDSNVSSLTSQFTPLPQSPSASNYNEVPAGLATGARHVSQSTDDPSYTSSRTSRLSTLQPPTIIEPISENVYYNETETSYQPHQQLSIQPVYYGNNARSPLSPSSIGQNILRTVGSLRQGPKRLQSKISRNSQYARISEENERDLGAGGMRRNSVEMEPMEHLAPAGVDFSSFGGPMPLSPGVGAAEARIPLTKDNERESKGVLTGGLGIGMKEKATLEIPQMPDEPFSPQFGRLGTIRRSTKRPARSTSTRQVGQEYAQKLGQMVAVVEEVAEFDLSVAEGGQRFGPPDEEVDSLKGPSNQTKQSYYFPEDPDKPNWKPFTMRWIWICLLIVLALTLAGVEEWLCQKSIRLAREGSGLLVFTAAQDVSILDFFTWKYLPTFVLVTYGIMWQTTDFEVKRLEPYYQLSKREGAKAAESLNIDYLTFWGIFAPFKALRYRQWAVILSSSSTLMSTGLIPVLQSAAVNLYLNPKMEDGVRDKYVRIDPTWSRIMEGFLLAVALQGIALLFFMRRKSGLQFDPKGIAGVAAMANRSHILQDFRDLDMAKPSVIHKQLKQRRYILHKSTIWQGEYVRSTKKDDDWETARADNPHPIMLRLYWYGVAYITFILIVIILIPIFMFTTANIVTEELPWLLTAVATMIKLVWSTLECDLRMIEPFFILSHLHAPPWILTLDYTGTVPGWMPIKAFINRHWLLFWVSFASILTEVLTVCVSSFNVNGRRFVSGQGYTDDCSQPHPPASCNDPNDPNNAIHDRDNTGETFKSFWISFGLVLGILITLVIIVSIVYARRRHAFLPREPGTIASVLAFIHQSKMLYDFAEDKGRRIEDMNSKEMTRHLTKINKRYGLGWFTGRDGHTHLGIDQEPLYKPYNHKQGDIRKGVLQGPADFGFI